MPVPKNLFNSDHKAVSDAYRDGWERTFRNDDPYRWDVTFQLPGSKIHCVPVPAPPYLTDPNQWVLPEHNTDSSECWCNPDIEETDEATIVIHKDKSEAS